MYLIMKMRLNVSIAKYTLFWSGPNVLFYVFAINAKQHTQTQI